MEKPIRYFAQKAGELSGHDEVLNSDLIESLPETGLTDRRASTGFPAWANETYSDISPFPGTFLGEPTSMNYLKYMFWACSGAPVHTAIPSAALFKVSPRIPCRRRRHPLSRWYRKDCRSCRGLGPQRDCVHPSLNRSCGESSLCLMASIRTPSRRCKCRQTQWYRRGFPASLWLDERRGRNHPSRCY